MGGGFWHGRVLVGARTRSKEQHLLVVVARVDGGGEEVVRGGDRVDVSRHVQIEILHRRALRVSAARRAALDAEGRAHRWLPDARHNPLVEVRAKRLGEADGGGALPLAERRRVDADDDDVVAVSAVGQAVIG